MLGCTSMGRWCMHTPAVRAAVPRRVRRRRPARVRRQQPLITAAASAATATCRHPRRMRRVALREGRGLRRERRCERCWASACNVSCSRTAARSSAAASSPSSFSRSRRRTAASATGRQAPKHTSPTAADAVSDGGRWPPRPRRSPRPPAVNSRPAASALRTRTPPPAHCLSRARLLSARPPAQPSLKQRSRPPRRAARPSKRIRARRPRARAAHGRARGCTRAPLGAVAG